MDQGAETRVKAMANELFQAHGLIRYSFGFDRAVRRAGQCDYQARRITLSKHFVVTSSIEQVQQVLLHEIAHALAGQQAGHGKIWKQKATEIGYRHEKLDGKEVAKNSAKYVGLCPGSHEHYRMRKPTRALSCKLCSPRFSANHLISWQES